MISWLQTETGFKLQTINFISLNPNYLTPAYRFMSSTKSAIVYLLAFIPTLVFSQDYPKDYFRAPLEIPLYLSGTFGELRTNHFHSGIDIKTDGREGQRVLAAADGVVSRIKVSAYGFGNAIYVVHPNGYTTVYAHLQRFNDEIQKYIKEEQYRQESFEVEIFPPASKFQVKKGQLIALSGNSGGSGGPHLHFEIRDTRTEKIINPLLFGFDVKDTKSPDLYSLEVYEFDGDELVSSYTKNLLRFKDGSYALAGNGVIEVTHAPAFGISTFDKLDGAPNKNGVYRIEMSVNEHTYYDFEARTFAFDESRYINAHIDYAQKSCCRRTINKLYLEPGNQFSGYRIHKKMNFPQLESDSLYPVKITVKDAAGNESVLAFQLKFIQPAIQPEAMPTPGATVFNYTQANTFKRDNFQMVLPEGALYNKMLVEYKKDAPCSECYSFIYEVASREIPVQKYYTLKIKPEGNFRGDKSKLAIASFKNGRIDDYEGGTWEDGYVVARTRQFGQFAVVADTVAPVIRPVGFRDGTNVSGLARIQFTITDNFSGIESYRPTIDGKWVLFEYDAKNKTIYASPSDFGVEAGEHNLELEVKDDKGNVARKSYRLIF